MKYELINAETLDSIVVEEPDYVTLTQTGTQYMSQNEMNGKILEIIELKYQDYINEKELFSDKENYMIFDEWFKDFDNTKIKIAVERLKEYEGEESFRNEMYDYAFITRIEVDDIINDSIDEIRDLLENGDMDIREYNDVRKGCQDWIDNRYNDIWVLLENYFCQ